MAPWLSKLAGSGKTTFGQIIELVEEAQDSKSKAQRVIDRFAKYYTPLIMLIALVVGLATKDVALPSPSWCLVAPGPGNWGAGVDRRRDRSGRQARGVDQGSASLRRFE